MKTKELVLKGKLADLKIKVCVEHVENQAISSYEEHILSRYEEIIVDTGIEKINDMMINLFGFRLEE